MNEDQKEQTNESRKDHDRPCTSKQAKNSDRRHSTDDDKKSRQNSQVSIISYSTKASEEEVPDLKPPIIEAKRAAGKKRNIKGRVRGRIQKRKRSTVRRAVRKTFKKRTLGAKRPRQRTSSTVWSQSTVCSEMSRSRSTSPCPHCGHRCRHPRYELAVKIKRRKNNLRRNMKTTSIKRKPGTRVQERLTEAIQAGSRCAMLSPLFVGTNAALTSEPNREPKMRTHQEVTPQMIYESIRSITMWTLGASTNAILEYMVRKYPVNPDVEALYEELCHKLLIAASAGICIQSIIVSDTPEGKVTHISEDSWCLACALRNRELTKDQITLFWNIYADTLKPVERKITSGE